jgi:hypothetical protein
MHLSQTPDAQMAGEVSGWAAFHSFVVALADKAGEAMAAVRNGGVYHGPEFRL